MIYIEKTTKNGNLNLIKNAKVGIKKIGSVGLPESNIFFFCSLMLASKIQYSPAAVVNITWSFGVTFTYHVQQVTKQCNQNEARDPKYHQGNYMWHHSVLCPWTCICVVCKYTNNNIKSNTCHF